MDLYKKPQLGHIEHVGHTWWIRYDGHIGKHGHCWHIIHYTYCRFGLIVHIEHGIYIGQVWHGGQIGNIGHCEYIWNYGHCYLTLWLWIVGLVGLLVQRLSSHNVLNTILD